MARTREFDEDLVLQKAVHLFWKKGYNGTSAQDLVEGLGISRSSLYDTFGDKRSLFIKSLQFYRKKITQDLNEMVETSENVQECISRIFQLEDTASVDTDFSKGCFMVNSAIELAPHDNEIAGIVNKHINAVEDILFQLVKRGQEAGAFTTTQEPRAMARFLYNSLSGIRVALKSDREKKIYTDIAKVTLSVLNPPVAQ